MSAPSPLGSNTTAEHPASTCLATKSSMRRLLPVPVAPLITQWRSRAASGIAPPGTSPEAPFPDASRGISSLAEPTGEPRRSAA
jgi:hypothetical protein